VFKQLNEVSEESTNSPILNYFIKDYKATTTRSKSDFNQLVQQYHDIKDTLTVYHKKQLVGQ